MWNSRCPRTPSYPGRLRFYDPLPPHKRERKAPKTLRRCSRPWQRRVQRHPPARAARLLRVAAGECGAPGAAARQATSSRESRRAARARSSAHADMAKRSIGICAVRVILPRRTWSALLDRSMPFERNPHYQELARRLCATYVNYSTGVSIVTGYKNTPDDVGDLWYWLADLAMIAATTN